jgi:class 3 adenylate cyclase
VNRCFAFIDLSGFTAYTDRHGDEQVVVVLAQLRVALREAAARRGVRVVKWLGDGAMLSSTMTDAVCALVVEMDFRMRSAIPSLAVRAGLDCGPVIMFEGDDYIGRCVNLASRLCDQAGSHEILATESVMTSRPAWIDADECQPRLVRGLERPVPVTALHLADPGDDAITDPVCQLTITRNHAVRGDNDRWFCSDACAGTWNERPGGEELTAAI